MRTASRMGTAFVVLWVSQLAWGQSGNEIQPVKLELYPTLECMGVEVTYKGDANFNATGSVLYRKPGEERWRTGHPFVRVSDEPMNRDGKGASNPRFVTSLFYLDENAEYEVKAEFQDPDGVPKNLEPGKARTRTSKVPVGSGKHYYVEAQAAEEGDGSKERPFKTLASAIQVGGPGDTIHFARGFYHLKGQNVLEKSGEEGAWLHLKADPGAVITDANPDLSGVGKLKWDLFKKDLNGRPIFRTPATHVWRVMIRKTPGDPASGYFLWGYHPDWQGTGWDHRDNGRRNGLSADHLVEDRPCMNEFGVFFQGRDGHLYLVLPRGLDDPAACDLQISEFAPEDVKGKEGLPPHDYSRRHGLFLTGHHVIVEGFTVELTVKMGALDFDNRKGGPFIFRNLTTYGSFGLKTSPRGLVEDCRFIFNSHWDWLHSPLTKNPDGKPGLIGGWTRIKNGFNDTHLIQIAQGSVFRFNQVSGHSNNVGYAGSGSNTDVYGNDIALVGDDCIEPDGKGLNIRVFGNRLRQFWNGFSDAPISVGPAFVFRNVFHEYGQSAFKIRNENDGVALYYHNTCYPSTDEKRMIGIYHGNSTAGGTCYNPSPLKRWMKTRNNIFIGKKLPYSCGGGKGPVLETLDFDYNALSVLGGALPDGFGAGEAHSVRALPAFANLAEADLRLAKEDDPCVDAGEVIKGINDEVPEPYQYKGKGPDLGACEFGAPLPQYGPRNRLPDEPLTQTTQKENP